MTNRNCWLCLHCSPRNQWSNFIYSYPLAGFHELDNGFRWKKLREKKKRNIYTFLHGTGSIVYFCVPVLKFLNWSGVWTGFAAYHFVSMVIFVCWISLYLNILWCWLSTVLDTGLYIVIHLYDMKNVWIYVIFCVRCWGVGWRSILFSSFCFKAAYNNSFDNVKLQLVFNLWQQQLKSFLYWYQFFLLCFCVFCFDFFFFYYLYWCFHLHFWALLMINMIILSRSLQDWVVLCVYVDMDECVLVLNNAKSSL